MHSEKVKIVYSSVNQLHILLLQLVSHVFIFYPLCFMMDEEHKSILKPTDT
jgi:TRAP-type mannitol/chloroaromatic compound transport system permease small subunit